MNLQNLCDRIVTISTNTPFDFTVNPPGRWNIYLEALIKFKVLCNLDNAVQLVTAFDQAETNYAVSFSREGRRLKEIINELKNYLAN